jgi:hypothetical protein
MSCTCLNTLTFLADGEHALGLFDIPNACAGPFNRPSELPTWGAYIRVPPRLLHRDLIPLHCCTFRATEETELDYLFMAGILSVVLRNQCVSRPRVSFFRGKERGQNPEHPKPNKNNTQTPQSAGKAGTTHTQSASKAGTMRQGVAATADTPGTGQKPVQPLHMGS